MKILFLNPPHSGGEIYMKEIGRCGRRAVAGEFWPQTGLAYLAAVAAKSGAESIIIDAMTEGCDFESLLSRISSYSPDMIIANTTTPTFNNDADVLRKIKESFPDTIVALTGTHASAVVEESLSKSSSDFIFINESEETLSEIIGLLTKSDFFSSKENKRCKIKDIIKEIRGIAYLENEKVVKSENRDFTDNLDTFPFPARELLPNHLYKMPFFEDEPFTTVIPTRGCPFQCIFCRAGKVWGRRIRTRSVNNVLDEISEIINKFKIRNIAFMTDSLTLNRKWTIEFLKGIIERRLNFRWVCNSRSDAVDSEMLGLMKKCGCKLISYGVESGNQEILDASKKGIKLEDCKNAIQLTKKAGIISMAYFIIGLPGETWETINQSIKFAIDINPDYVNFHVATPFPGTELFDIAGEKGWLISRNWEDYEEEGSAVMRTENLSAEELIKAQKLAMKRFYLRPSRLLKELLSIKSFAQLKSHFKAGIKIFKILGEK